MRVRFLLEIAQDAITLPYTRQLAKSRKPGNHPQLYFGRRMMGGTAVFAACFDSLTMRIFTI